MAFNFGAFAGGLSTGIERGIKLVDSIDEMQKKSRLQKLREEGMAEAEAQRAKSVADMVKEGGMTGQPASGPVDTSTPKVETPEASQANAASVSAASPTANPDTAGAATAAAPYQGVVVTPVPEPGTPNAPTASPDAAGSATASGTYAAAPSVSTQTPAAPAPEAKAPAQPATVQASPAQAQAAQATPQAVAATGIAKKANGKFTVNGESYDTREQAMAAAERSAPSATDLFMKNTVPKLAAQYVINGEPEKAKAWTDYAESVNGKRAIKDWAAAYTAPDMDTAVTKFGKYYTDHINDGVDYTGHKMLQKADGSQVAVVTLKDKATGKSIEMELTREKMLAMGGANNPQKLFEQEVAKQAAAEKMKFEAGLKAQERKAKREDDLYMEGVRQGGRLQVEGIKSKNRMDELGLKAQLESDLGEDAARRYAKMTDPAERAAILDKAFSESGHPDNRTFSKLSREEKDKFIADRIQSYDNIGESLRKKDTPMIKPVPPVKGVEIIELQKDKNGFKKGQKFQVINGQHIPVEDPVTPSAPAAGGLPKR